MKSGSRSGCAPNNVSLAREKYKHHSFVTAIVLIKGARLQKPLEDLLVLFTPSKMTVDYYCDHETLQACPYREQTDQPGSYHNKCNFNSVIPFCEGKEAE
eukprot:g35699.t1